VLTQTYGQTVEHLEELYIQVKGLRSLKLLHSVSCTVDVIQMHFFIRSAE
jgi:hypothetical protein